jgi:hypothetical protein
MMKLVILLLIIYPFSFLLPGEAKTVYIPEDIAIEEDAVQVTKIRNVSELEIYRSFHIFFIDDFIYISDYVTPSIVKLSTRGELIARFGRKGQGPGESPTFREISKFQENIAILGRYKIIICNKDLQYLSEKRFSQLFTGFIFSTNNQFYFYNNPSYENHYFSVYTRDFKFIKKFGIKNPNFKEKKITPQNYSFSLDTIRCALYVPEENSIWISFKNRYDLRCYKNEKLVVDIETKKPFFASTEDVFSGVKVRLYTDYSRLIAKWENQLYHFFVKGEQLFCDIFDLSGNYRLLRRIKFPYIFSLAHTHGSTFYGLSAGGDQENINLYKIQINKKGGNNDNLKISR